MASPTTDPILVIEMRCGCGACFFVELRQDSEVTFAWDRILKLAALAGTWTTAHAAHHADKPAQPESP